MVVGYTSQPALVKNVVVRAEVRVLGFLLREPLEQLLVESRKRVGTGVPCRVDEGVEV